MQSMEQEYQGPWQTRSADNCQKEKMDYQHMLQQQHMQIMETERSDSIGKKRELDVVFSFEYFRMLISNDVIPFIFITLYSLTVLSDQELAPVFQSAEADLKLVARGSQSLSLTSSV